MAPLDASALSALMARYDPLSRQAGRLTFPAVQGMLKGFIDLVFEHQGRWYLLDYKSNYLGADYSAYQEPALSQAMLAHRYDLQYQLYTLALHRLLQQRLPGYEPERPVSGIRRWIWRCLMPWMRCLVERKHDGCYASYGVATAQGLG